MPNIQPAINQASNLTPPKKVGIKIPLWLAIPIILAVTFCVAVIIVVLAYINPVDFIKETPLQKESMGPAVINSYVGEIIKIGENNFTLEVSSDKNFLKDDAVILVKTKTETIITSLNIPKTISDPNKPLTLTKELIKFKDLKIGQVVVVFSNQNIKNQTEITVDTVEVQNVK